MIIQQLKADWLKGYACMSRRANFYTNNVTEMLQAIKTTDKIAKKELYFPTCRFGTIYKVIKQVLRKITSRILFL